MMILAAVIAALVVVGTVAVVGRTFMLKAMTPNFDWSPHFPGTTPVVLALTNKLPRRNMDVAIIRRATIKPYDVILIRPAVARAELLARAVQTLQATRHTFGRLPAHDSIIRVESAGVGLPPRMDEAERWVDSLRGARVMWLPGVGPAQYMGLHVFDAEGAEAPASVGSDPAAPYR